MKRAIGLMAFIITVMSTSGYAEPLDNSTRQPGKEGSSPSGNTSYFQGTWTGAWPTGSDVTITIGNKNEEGVYDTKYTWGYGKFRDGVVIPPGSVNASGREQGEEFTIEWKGKDGIKRDIKLEKYKDKVVKAKLTLAGPAIKAGYRSFIEAYLDRK